MSKVSEKYWTENQNTRFMFNINFPRIVPFFGIMWINMVEPDRPQKKLQYGACALYAG